MSQGVLFRGQPEQTEEEDGRNQKADAEYVIRSGFVKGDFIECVIVLPSKLFYGNNVPGCLIVLNKRKAPDRKGKILLIWASRHFQKSNPQNILRPSDLMRVLVPWGGFGDLERAKGLVPKHEARLVAEEEAERDRRMKDIEEAYAPLLETVPALRAELGLLDHSNYGTWNAKLQAEHAFFGALAGIEDKSKLRIATNEAKKAYAKRLKELKADIKELEKFQAERDERDKEVKDQFDREISHIHEAAADLLRICSDQQEAGRYFSIADPQEITENEFNLNLPRYVDTFEPEEEIPLKNALRELELASQAASEAQKRLFALMERAGVGA
jgi:type I restriction enzyme M protein